MFKLEKELLKKFIEKVDDIYGIYLDSTNGFLSNKKGIEKIQVRSHTSVSDLDKELIIYGRGNPSTKESYPLHICSQGEYKKRNKLNGKNYQIIAGLCLTTIYDYWEDYYRGKIAKVHDVDKNSIVWDIMGDLKHFRHSIIHHQGVAISKIENCKILKWFKKDEIISINKDQFEDIIRTIKKTSFKNKNG